VLTWARTGGATRAQLAVALLGGSGSPWAAALRAQAALEESWRAGRPRDGWRFDGQCQLRSRC
jgi:hypothetical protein